MDLSELVARYATHPQVKAIRSFTEKSNHHRTIILKGLNGGSGNVMTIATLFLESGGCFLCIMNDPEEAGYFYNDLMQMLPDEHVLFFPSAYQRHIKYGNPDPANEILRTETLTAKLSCAVVVTYPDALAEKVSSAEDMKANTLQLHVNETIDSLFLSDVLDTLGFQLTDYVYEPGQYAIRGSILDIYSFSNEYPYRIDFFGNEIESIRTFDVDTQLSKETLHEITVIADANRCHSAKIPLFELLPADTTLVANDLEWCAERIDSLWNDVPPTGKEGLFATIDDIRNRIIRKADFVRFATQFGQIQIGNKAAYPHSETATVSFDSEPQPLYRKNFDALSQSLQNYLAEGYTLYILTDSGKQAERLQAIFRDRGEQIPFTHVNRTIHGGFVDHTLKMCMLTDHQVFGRYHKYNLKSDKVRSGKMMLSLKELNRFTTGDFIVHIDHGVGQFGGLVRTSVNGKLQEAVKLIYLNNDIIFVSIHALHKLSKYKGKDGEPPPLNKLGSGAWERLKERTKKKVKDIARDLIRIYAQRKHEKGFAFSHDSFLQNELEASFVYEDTPDQMKAATEIKSDMESDHPMDRLICGDVGFGKTEVAIRAAFKAITDNKQVAVLVPTTVLAFQHFKTFAERLKNFPCTVDYLSRARSQSETTKIREQLKSGELNILIGTHRIVSSDIIFKDLGLLIIDEEQKFGVAVKEKLRTLKTNVDTLTLTATPIPRTLQFSLMGARDLSNIHTPPPNRYPIQTEVHRFDTDVIREAIEFELSRNGQVFFINNRIQNINEIEKMIRREIPDARTAIGHGQMQPDMLEKIILDFVNYEYDVLIATTIIENGLDIPNANTIIVNNAHQFGLAELHQLRGRVGRSNRKAFCYLLSPPLTTLTSEARRRLQAIENFAELGSGIHIAMQDLDIRGAGNILGAEQSGFIADLGFETYQKVLEEAINELKTDEFATEFAGNDANADTEQPFVRETFIESDLQLMFSPAYIPNDSERIAIYRELGAIDNDRRLADFVTKLVDRFGKIPPEGEELIRIVTLRQSARKMGAEKVVLKRGMLVMYLPSAADSPYFHSKTFGKVIAYIQQHPRECVIRETGGKRSVVIQHIAGATEACRCLNEMENMPIV